MQYIADYGRSYATREEYEFRYALFKENLDFHAAHNEKNLTWTVGVNHMSDMSRDEIKGLMGYNPKLDRDNKGTPCGAGECPIDDAVCC
jgi:hypothetical protein